jgi:molybdate transport system regulatory protein
MGESKLSTNLRIRLWFENSKGEAFFGEGISGLLKAIDEEKSIAIACKEIGMSYRYALHRIAMAEKRSGMILVKRYRGGGSRGGAELTETCRLLLQRYSEAKRILQDFARSM